MRNSQEGLGQERTDEQWRQMGIESRRIVTQAYFESRLAEPSAGPTELYLSDDHKKIRIRTKSEEGEVVNEDKKEG